MAWDPQSFTGNFDLDLHVILQNGQGVEVFRGFSRHHVFQFCLHLIQTFLKQPGEKTKQNTQPIHQEKKNPKVWGLKKKNLRHKRKQEEKENNLLFFDFGKLLLQI